MTYDEMMQQLANAQPARFAAPTPVVKALPSGVGLSTRDAALIKGLAAGLHEHIQSEIAKAVAPLKAQIAELKTLTASRPPAGERRDLRDAGDPDYYWRQ
jgi:hypothetical protein